MQSDQNFGRPENAQRRDESRMPHDAPSLQAARLRGQLHDVFPDTVGDKPPLDRFNYPRPRQIEFFASTQTPSYRYLPLLSYEHFRFVDGLAPLGAFRHPGLNFGVERMLALTADKLLNGLDGKTIVQLRPEYHPFFGIQAAALGARSILVEPRAISQVENLIRGAVQPTPEAAVEGAQRAKDFHRRILAENSVDALLHVLSPAQILETITRNEFRMDESLWRTVSRDEQMHDILTVIASNASSWLEPYFGYSSRLEPASFTLRALEQIGTQVLRSALQSAIQSDERRAAQDRLFTDAQSASLAYHHIYSPLIGESIQGSQFVERLQALLCQSNDQEYQRKTFERLDFRYGTSLAQAELTPGSVNLLMCGWGLDHLENIGDFLREARPALARDGLLMGYVKSENLHTTLRDLSTPEKLLPLLAAAGFSRPVVIAEEPPPPGVSTNRQNVGMVFFAHPDEFVAESSPKIFIQAPRSPLLDLSYHALSPAEDRVKTEATVQRAPNVSFEATVSELASNERAVQMLSEKLFGFDASPLERTDVGNLLLALRDRTLRGEALNLDGLPDGVRAALEKYVSRQTQFFALLEDIKEFSDALNHLRPRDEIERRIEARGAALGSDEITLWLRGIRAATQRTEISFDGTCDFQAAISSAQNEISGSPGAFREWRSAMQQLERRFEIMLDEERIAAFEPLAAQLSRYFAAEHWWCQLELRSSALIVASLGSVEQIREYEFLGERAAVRHVWERIARNHECEGVCISEGSHEDPTLAVFLAPLAEKAAVLRDVLGRDDHGGPLRARQWPLGRAVQFTDIFEDLCHAISAHEIIHRVSESETIAAFAEVAFGRAPYESARTYLDFAVRGYSDFIERALTRGEAAKFDPYVTAGAILVGSLLKSVVDDERLTLLQQQRIAGLLISNDENTFIDVEKVRHDRNLVEETLAILSSEEIRSIARATLLGDAYDCRENLELTAGLPLPQLPQHFAGNQYWRPRVLHEGSNHVVQGMLAASLDSGSAWERFRSLERVSKVVALFSAEHAWQAAESLEWGFAQAQMHLSAASERFRLGAAEDSLRALRRAESLLAPSPTVMSESFPLYRQFGEQALLYGRILPLKVQLGLLDEVREFAGQLRDYAVVHGVPHDSEALTLVKDATRFFFEAGDSREGRVSLRILGDMVSRARDAGNWMSSSWETDRALLLYEFGGHRARTHALSRLSVTALEDVKLLASIAQISNKHMPSASVSALMRNWLDRLEHQLQGNAKDSHRDGITWHEMSHVAYILGMEKRAARYLDISIELLDRVLTEAGDTAGQYGDLFAAPVHWMAHFESLRPRALQLARSIECDFRARGKALASIMAAQLDSWSLADSSEKRRILARQVLGLAQEVSECLDGKVDRLICSYIQDTLEP